MRALALLYHDVVAADDWDASGFSGAGASSYKLERGHFERHLAAIRTAAVAHGTVRDLVAGSPSPAGPRRVLMTFDDGGASAYGCTADLLEDVGWRGHFLITTDYLGTKGFVTGAQIRDLAARGHVIGTHSCSHPAIMSACSWHQLVDEWTRSTAVLGDVLGEPVRVGSVPGGNFSRRVAAAAAAAGMTALFTSEPTTRCRSVAGCLVVGRYTLRRDTPVAAAAALASGRVVARLRQVAWWNLKKVAKGIGGHAYLALRRAIYERA